MTQRIADQASISAQRQPRLEAAGGAPDKVHVIESVVMQNKRRGFNLTEDVERLGKAIDELGDVRLVRFDPINAYLGKPGKLDSYRDSDMRAILTPLCQLAEQKRVAMFGIMHLPKTLSAKAVSSAIGSVAFSAAARSVYLAVPDPTVPGRRLLLKAKNNLAPPMLGLAYTIDVKQVTPEIAAPVVVWGTEQVAISADEALRASRSGAGSQGRVVAWLRAALAGSPRLAASLTSEAEAAGFTDKQVRAAREKLGVRATKSKGKGATGWVWSLPDASVISDQDDLPF